MTNAEWRIWLQEQGIAVSNRRLSVVLSVARTLPSFQSGTPDGQKAYVLGRFSKGQQSEKNQPVTLDSPAFETDPQTTSTAPSNDDIIRTGGGTIAVHNMEPGSRGLKRLTISIRQ